MKTLREHIKEARDQRKAIGHFNFSSLEGLWAIADAAQELGVPVIVGTSEGERNAVGTVQAVALVKAFRESHGIEIFLNADHHYSFESVKEVLDAGYDSAIIDGATLSLDENISQAKQCVDYARTLGRDILIEVELGYIGKSSKMLEDVPEGVSLDMLTKPEDVHRLITESGADLIAPAVGNIHGMLKSGINPHLHIEQIRAIAERGGAPVVLHGGSGNDTEFTDAIEAGVVIIHVNTQLRKSYTTALKTHLDTHPEDIAPYIYGKTARDAMKEEVLKTLRICNKL
jgi:fructose-bisphosphate aldolase class II